MYHLIIASILAVLFSTTAFAGPNSMGTLILHANPGLTYTTDTTTWCGSDALTSCADAIVEVDAAPAVPTVFFAFAAFPDYVSPRLTGVAFGIAYQAADFILLGHGSCADFELADPAWPASGFGTSITWGQAQTTHLTSAYWFAGYCYGDSTRVDLVPHSNGGSAFVDDSVPAESDSILAYGSLGFRTTGAAPCPVDRQVDPAFITEELGADTTMVIRIGSVPIAVDFGWRSLAVAG